jgi:hypothetical protein
MERFLMLNQATRRKFLAGVAACAIAISLPMESLAFTHGSAFNGGTSQINLNLLGGLESGEFAFIDYFKTSQEWAQINIGGSGFKNAPTTPDLLDANQHPVDFTSNGGFQTAFYVPPVADRPGNYIVMTFGEGTAQSTGSSVITSSANVWTRTVATPNSADGRIAFNILTRGVSSYISKCSRLS